MQASLRALGLMVHDKPCEDVSPENNYGERRYDSQEHCRAYLWPWAIGRHVNKNTSWAPARSLEPDLLGLYVGLATFRLSVFEQFI